MSNYDVLIAGAGPTGLTLANILGQAGCRTLLVERLDALIDYPRAIGIDDEALRSMQAIGLIDQVLPHTVPHHMVRAVDAEGRLVSEMAPTTDVFGWPRRNGFIQPLVDQALLKGLERFDCVTVRFGTELVGLTDDGDQVTATLRTVATGEEEQITSEYMVGTEGGRSFTRSWLGVEFAGKTLKRVVVIDAKDDPIGTPNAIFGAEGRSWATFGLPHGVRRWEFLLREDEPNELAESDDFVRRLLADHVPDPDAVNITRVRAYQHNARVASSFGRGRVYLAGDAAHVMPVNAGQGWNSCIRDAVNLGWKLTTVLAGQATPELLDSYALERRDHVKKMVDLSVDMGNTFASRNLAGSIKRRGIGLAKALPPVRSYMASMRFKPMPRYTRGVVVPVPETRSKSVLGAHRRSRAVGTLFPQPRIHDSTGRRLLLDDAFGYHWLVLTWGNDPLRLLGDEQVKAFQRLGARFVQVVPEVQRTWQCEHTSPGVDVIGDVDGRLKAWFDTKDTSVAFVRPDRVIAGECLALDADATARALLAVLHYQAPTEPANGKE